jgi:hypothetical protein
MTATTAAMARFSVRSNQTGKLFMALSGVQDCAAASRMSRTASATPPSQAGP